MDIAEIVERLLTGLAQGHAQLEATVAALKSTCDDVPLPHRDSFFTHLLLRLYREALEKQQYQRIIPILHAWASFGPADSLPAYLYGTRTFDHDQVEHWTREVLPVFRFVLGNYADRFSDEAVDAVLHDCATLGQAEPLLRQAPLAEHLLKNVQALAETAQYIRHHRFLRSIAHPQQQPQAKEYDDRLPLYRRRLFDEDLDSRFAHSKRGSAPHLSNAGPRPLQACERHAWPSDRRCSLAGMRTIGGASSAGQRACVPLWR